MKGKINIRHKVRKFVFSRLFLFMTILFGENKTKKKVKTFILLVNLFIILFSF